MYTIRLFTAALTLAATATLSAEPYKVIFPIAQAEKGTLVTINDYDTGTPLDSAYVSDQAATFTGTIDEPVLVRVSPANGRGPVFILESGTISFNKDYKPFGTMLNDALRNTYDEINTIVAEYEAATTDEERQNAYNRVTAVCDRIVDENSDNPLGYYYFLQSLSEKDNAQDIKTLIKKYPAFENFKRTQTMLDAAVKREATMPGKKYTDFEVTYDGTTKRLSDYIGNGKYTLVDFWASWCGPCIRQTKVLKELYEQYKDKGLQVVGVAVWDQPEATKKAITAHKLPWENIINAQTIPTDIYGITGIPSIFLIGPDGTILSRDKQDDDLRADVRKAIEGK